MTRSLDGSIRTVGVVGAGTMGHGIAHTFLRHGYAVFLHDTSSEFLQAGVVKIHKGLERDVEKGRLSTDQKGQAVASLRPVTDMAAFAGIDFAIEAVTENFEVKASIFRALDEACGPRVIFASNTSSISITKLAAVTHRPVRFVGLHFFNPVPVMKLVEVVAGLRTSPATMEAAVALAAAVGKTPVRANDFPGFVSKPGADAHDQRGRLLRHGRRGGAESRGRGDEAGYESPHGTAGTRGLHRPRRVPGYHESAPRRLSRFEVSALPAAREDSGRRLAGKENRTRVLRVRLDDPRTSRGRRRRSPSPGKAGVALGHRRRRELPGRLPRAVEGGVHRKNWSRC